MSAEVLGILNELRRVLPSQGPLEFFVHHNTFHCMEDIPFKEALLKGQKLYQGRVLKSQIQYQQDLTAGKINRKILKAVVKKFLDKHGLTEEVHIHFCEDLLMMRTSSGDINPQDILGLEHLNNKDHKSVKFFKTAFLKRFNIDFDEIISPSIYRFLSLFYDQGIAYWRMSDREQGLLSAFKYHFSSAPFFASKWERKLAQIIKQIENKKSLEIISFVLEELGVESKKTQDYLFDLSYRYKGWGGLILSFEKHPEWLKRKDVNGGSFDDFVALLMIFELAFISSLSSKKQTDLKENCPVEISEPCFSAHFLKDANFVIASKYKGLDPDSLIHIVELLSDFERQFLLHQAYEETFYESFLSSFLKCQENPTKPSSQPRLQVLCCIDDREESIRRHIEELAPDVETMGGAGHFGLDIKFKGIFNAHYRALCPDIIKPTKEIGEELLEGDNARKLYSLWGNILWMQTIGSKTLIRGFILQLLTGLISIFSLSLTVISPFWVSRLRHKVKSHLDNQIKTKLLYENGHKNGVTLDEMATYGRNLLKTVGLVESFAPVVVILGHGSHSLNNPHKAAYDCGACGGGQGAPNARLISQILNRADVRSLLRKDNIDIPESTVFVGGYHNTCSDEILIFDQPVRRDVAESVDLIRKAAQMDALERCRKFEDVPLGIEAREAANHCLGRANNYMQPRPEYCHATNALCFVGPRHMSRGLFLDRRAFLTSYEPNQDSENADILRNILAAVGPVCSGINLEYYFSYMDNDVYGCGTKLAHNVTALVGVMNGYQSDLKMGLSWQMVEIHEPFRLMMLLTCQKEKVERIIIELESFRLLVTNQWIHLAIYDPDLKTLFRYREGEMVALNYEHTEVPLYKSQKEAFSNKRGACQIGIVRS